jgi:DNA-nicking Smr family endonuclease
MGRDRQLSERERALWRHVMRDVRRLSDDEEPAEPVTEAEPVPAMKNEPPPPISGPRSEAPSRSGGAAGASVDRRIWQRLRRGRYPVSARLDLHGLSQERAWQQLVAFIAREQASGSRCVLVITGTGARTGGGILRTMTPHWLEAPPNASRVIGYAPAGRSHGGEGAFYVLLRRKPEAVSGPSRVGAQR